MSVTRIDIDDGALAEVVLLSGAATEKEAVELALREYVERRRRTESRLRHVRAARQWDEAAFWREHAAEKEASSAVHPVDGGEAEDGGPGREAP